MDDAYLCCGGTELLSAYSLTNRPGQVSHICSECASDIYLETKDSEYAPELDELSNLKRKLQRLSAKPESEMTERDRAEAERIYNRLCELWMDSTD